MKSPFKKRLTLLFMYFIILSIMPASCTTAGTNSSQKAEGKKLSWTIEYSISGGFAGIRRQLIINSSGHLTAKDQKLKKDVGQQISQKQLAEIINILEQLNYSLDMENASKLSGRCADCFIYTLSITADDRKEKITLNDLSLQGSKHSELIRLLSTMLDQALK